MVDNTVLKVLICPADKGKLIHKGNKLICEKCGKEYPIREGIPDMR